MPPAAATPPQRRPEVAIAGVLVLAAVAYFLYAALWSYVWQFRASTSFVPVRATVLESSVQSRGSQATTQGQTFVPRIVYRYRVDGTDHQSERYFFTGDGWRNAEAAAATAARFPIGAIIEAYVDPGRPDRAVIDRSRPTAGILLFLLPAVLAGLALLAYGLGLFGRKPRHV